MKEKIITTITLSLSFFAFTAFSQTTVNQTAEEKTRNEKDIAKAIADETGAFLRKDSTLLFSFYSDDVLTQSVWNNPDGSYTILKGKEQIINSLSFALKRRSLTQTFPDVERINWFFKHLSKEYVWVNFDQILNYKDGRKILTNETRIMKLEKSSWKTTATIALSNHTVK